jgi:hypothetical protein
VASNGAQIAPAARIMDLVPTLAKRSAAESREDGAQRWTAFASG